MFGFEENAPLYFGGEKQKNGAFVDIKEFSEVNPDQASQMTVLACQTMEMVLGIPADKTYVTYQGLTDWGWNRRNY